MAFVKSSTYGKEMPIKNIVLSLNDDGETRFRSCDRECGCNNPCMEDELTNEALSPPNPLKRISGKQRKATLEEYQQTFLQVPRIDDRKPVFVSSDVRDRLDRVVRILGGRRMSVSGIIENIVRHHLSLYEEDFEAWRKL